MKVVADFSSFLGLENIFLKVKKDIDIKVSPLKLMLRILNIFSLKTVVTFEFRTKNSLFFNL